MRTTRVFDRIVKNHGARVQVLQGGTSAGKSYAIMQYLIYIAINTPGPLLISVVAETLPVIKKGVEKDFFTILGDSYDERYHNKTERQYRFGKNIIEFFSADQPARARGPRRDILFVNEANNVHQEVYGQLAIRTRLKIFLDFNPVEQFWAHDLLKEPGVSFDVSCYLDNQYLDPNIIKAIEAKRYDGDGKETNWWRIYGTGQIGVTQGVVYDNWEQIDSFPDTDRVTHGLDFGFTNDQTAICRTALSGGSIYCKELLYETGLTNDDIDIRMSAIGMEKRNSAIYADSAEPKSIEEIRRKGWAIRGAVKGKDSVRVGIDWVKSHRLYVPKDSLNMIKELRNYRWMVDSNGKPTNIPVDAYDHLLSAMRYSLSYKIQSSEIRSAKVRY